MLFIFITNNCSIARASDKLTKSFLFLFTGGHSTFFGLLNTFVHIIMYFYYMVSAMGPRYARFIWWKKYLTTIQMIQFIMISGHCFQLCFIECDYPKAFVWWIGLHGVLFLVLFSNFYKKSYKPEDNGELDAQKSKTPPSTLKSNFCDGDFSTGLDSNSNGIKLKSI